MASSITAGDRGCNPLWYKRYVCREIVRYAKDYIIALWIYDKEMIVCRDLRIRNMDDIYHILGWLGDRKHNFYVVGFKFNWKLAEERIRKTSYNPSHGRGNAISLQLRNLRDSSPLFLTKEVVFDLDCEDIGLAGNFALELIEGLKGMGIKGVHCNFSGTQGYHIVIEDAIPYFDEYYPHWRRYGVNKETLKNYALKMAGKILDASVRYGFEDRRGHGRTYSIAGDEVEVDYSPMYQQGLRKLPYTMTKRGTICFPVTLKMLGEAKDSSYYGWYPVMNYTNEYGNISGRGIPKLL